MEEDKEQTHTVLWSVPTTGSKVCTDRQQSIVNGPKSLIQSLKTTKRKQENILSNRFRQNILKNQSNWTQKPTPKIEK